nr:hypothetical protein WMHIBSEC_WMHIBSEC_CDS_0031 [Caudoviricetes sp.]CAI9751730.1 hypothetical protein AZFZUZMX_AZFZUZMX_CDS_0031 [Caudoviricetes sp.]
MWHTLHACQVPSLDRHRGVQYVFNCYVIFVW